MTPEEKAKILVIELAVRMLTAEQVSKLKKHALMVARSIVETLEEFSKNKPSSQQEAKETIEFWIEVEKHINDLKI